MCQLLPTPIFHPLAQVHYIWECSYDRLKETSPELKAFLEEYYAEGERPRERLALRDTLKGGRVEGFYLLFLSEENPGRIIFYIDKTSLYPFVAILHR